MSVVISLTSQTLRPISSSLLPLLAFPPTWRTSLCPWLLSFCHVSLFMFTSRCWNLEPCYPDSYFSWCLLQKLSHCSSPFTIREHKCRGYFTLVQGYPLLCELSHWKLISLSLLSHLWWQAALSGSKILMCLFASVSFVLFSFPFFMPFLSFPCCVPSQIW